MDKRGIVVNSSVRLLRAVRLGFFGEEKQKEEQHESSAFVTHWYRHRRDSRFRFRIIRKATERRRGNTSYPAVVSDGFRLCRPAEKMFPKKNGKLIYRNAVLRHHRHPKHLSEIGSAASAAWPPC